MGICFLLDCCERDTTLPSDERVSLAGFEQGTHNSLSTTGRGGFEQGTHNSLSTTGRVKSSCTTNTESTTQSDVVYHEDHFVANSGKGTESKDIGLSFSSDGRMVTKSKEIELTNQENGRYVTKLKVLEKDSRQRSNLSIGKSMTLQTGDCTIEVPVLPSPSTTTTVQSFGDGTQTENQTTNPPTVTEASPPPVITTTTLPPLPPRPPLSETHQKLALSHPTATEQEITRFLTANKQNLKKTEKHLQTYLQWRLTCRLDDPPPDIAACCSSSAEDFQSCASSSVTEDENDWNCASCAAMSLERGSSNVESLPVLPRLARMDDVDGNAEMRDRGGFRIVQLNPAMVDPKLANEDTYANCIAFYLDRRFARTSMEKLVLSVDLRGGDGWACPPAKSIIPFIQQMISVIDRNFPDRLSCSLVWPMPWVAVMLWKTVKVFLDPQTAEKVKVLKAPAERYSPPPFSQMDKYIERSVVERMERNRTSTIVL